MAHITADRVKDTTTTTGTGSLTLANSAPTGYRTLNAVAATGDTFPYCVEGGSEWEVGRGTYSGSHVFARTTVIASSNSNAAVNFSAGTKNFFITLPAADIVSSPYPYGLYLPRKVDFIYTPDGTEPLTTNTLAAGGAFSIGAFNSIGLTKVDNGTGRTVVRITRTAANHSFSLGAQGASTVWPIQDIDSLTSAKYKMRLRPRSASAAAPDATDDYEIYWGFMDYLSSGGITSATDCAMFAYYYSSGVKFESRTRRSSGSFEVTTLTAPSADTTYTYEIIVTSSDVKFYIDGSLVATHTTVPNGEHVHELFYRSKAGTSSRSADLYYIAVSLEASSDV